MTRASYPVSYRKKDGGTTLASYSHIDSSGRIRKYAVGHNNPRYGLMESKINDLDFKAAVESAQHEKGWNLKARYDLGNIREKGWGLSGRLDRIKALNKLGFVWNWGDPERTERTKEELAKYGWAAMWVKKSDREWYRQHRKPLQSWVDAQNAPPPKSPGPRLA